MATRLFNDRADAGRYLAVELAGYAGRDDVVVLALPRGGVPVAYEVARALNAPLGVFLVRKLGVPDDLEFAMGAIASGVPPLMNHWVVDALRIPGSSTGRRRGAVVFRPEEERHVGGNHHHCGARRVGAVALASGPT